MNLVILHSHDTGRFVSPYDPRVATPNLASLAAEGVVFHNAHCAAPTCSPSRAALFTGQWAHQTGMLGLSHRGFALAKPERHLARYLSGLGYHTVLCGLHHEHGPAHTTAASAAHLGYEIFLAPCAEDRSLERDLATGRRAARWLRERPARPFFLSVGFFNTHRPFPSAAGAPKGGRPWLDLPDVGPVREDLAGLRASVSALDAAVGEILDALQSTGLEENTLVLYTTDHGLPFPGMKCTLSDSGTGVALIVRPPGGGPMRRCDALVSHVDVFPTLCDMLGVPAPDWLEGSSLRPLIEGRAESVREELFAEITFHAAYEPVRSVRTRQHKYIRRFDASRAPVRPNMDDSPTKAWMLASPAGLPAPATEQLFDVLADPAEERDLIADPAHAAVRAALATRLERWMRATDDPLLNGPVPPPPGARLEQPDAGCAPLMARS